MAQTPFKLSCHRAIRLLCPRCGEGRLFAGFLRMHKTCSGCGLKFEREPGYFLGSSYINYGWTALSLTIAYIVLRIVLEYPNRYVLPPLVTYSIAFPLCFHRYARSLWLAIDCYLDHTDLRDPPAPGDADNNGRNDVATRDSKED